MRHVVVDEWSRGASCLHRRHSLAKLICLLLVLIAVGLPLKNPAYVLLCIVPMIAAGVWIARLPAGAFLARTCTILPFAIVFAGLTALSGDRDRAAYLVLRAWFSAAAILLVVGTTPLPRMLHALRRIGSPALLVEIIQLIYRYLFVLAEQVWRMRNAAASRAGQSSLRAASATVTTLFARSYERAERIHRAMLARAYSGELPVASGERWTAGDAALLTAVVLYLLPSVLKAGA